ncbi:plasmid pRiA4b ORF-3 family protein [Actinophytocola sp.]|uniref:plasmid pRiA4b ORF-3 family protein n=1 Tax=Actinophytocola sp. TaxID=1872138 RepID=UPI002D3EDEF0|nr:plasmid pRiA4b ORF-3 family protein [Actinophytocola sp.]HYQ62661.1 plasmid pRiA4b ORF-3 family protein [Actinophytocola sp.]
MSPESRGRKPKKRDKSAVRSAPLSLVADTEPCDCPACAGPPVELSELVDGILAAVADGAFPTDPMAAEFGAALFVAMCELAGEDYEDALVHGFVPEFESRADSAALIMLLALGSVCGGRAGEAAGDAARRMVGAGVESPVWAAEVAEPLLVGDCWRFADPTGAGAMLICTFDRAGRSHAFTVGVDDTDCGAAVSIELLDAEGVSQAMEMVRRSGVSVSEERLDPTELRWQVECALDARAAHDVGELPLDEDGLPDYYPLAVLLRARLRGLPDSGKPKPPHEDSLSSLPRLLDARAMRPVPPKPTGPAPVYQLKVGLSGAKPPIWRRLEVPADVSLDRLHVIIQVAFDWDGSHLHVFETPYGDFGLPDPELGHRPADEVSLAQVLPGERAKITYVYDFGDNWRHEIVVEKVLDPDGLVTYPRCTGGRRATPPEDCGGIWSYADLLEVLADPAHPEHANSLEWLGLDSAAEFDPAAFDAPAITKALSSLS